MNKNVLEIIKETLEKKQIPYICGKTWTTDGYFRETEKKVEMRKEEGALTVEMEAASFFAVAMFRGVELGQIIYGGDDVSGMGYDMRLEQTREKIRKDLVELSLSIALQLEEECKG